MLGVAECCVGHGHFNATSKNGSFFLYVRILFPDLPEVYHPVEIYAEPDKDKLTDSTASESIDGIEEDIER